MNSAKIFVPVLLCCAAQVNATMMQYNTRNQMVKSDHQSMLYSPRGYLAAVDDINIMHMEGSGIIEQQGSMVTTTFGGVRLISNGVAQTIFTDNHSTLKTTSSDKNQRSYTDPYGNSIQKVTKESYPLESNRLTFDGGYKINKDITNFNARNYILPFKVFSSMDSSNVANRYNFSDGNPIMKFDPSGHNAQKIANYILTGSGAIVGIIIAFTSVGLAPVTAGVFGALSGAFGIAGQAISDATISSINDDDPDKLKKQRRAHAFQNVSTALAVVSIFADAIGGALMYRNKPSAMNLNETKSFSSSEESITIEEKQEKEIFTSNRNKQKYDKHFKTLLKKSNKNIGLNENNSNVSTNVSAKVLPKVSPEEMERLKRRATSLNNDVKSSLYIKKMMRLEGINNISKEKNITENIINNPRLRLTVNEEIDTSVSAQSLDKSSHKSGLSIIKEFPENSYLDQWRGSFGKVQLIYV